MNKELKKHLLDMINDEKDVEVINKFLTSVVTYQSRYHDFKRSDTPESEALCRWNMADEKKRFFKILRENNLEFVTLESLIDY